ncbi:MAG TPA: hypothetical protein VFA66_07850 [Gaiellaceae bacterium]|nr:hypothetical protein [Gaiellaceae bacterium]
MPPQSIFIAVVAAGLPACLARLWWLWWKSTCLGCGLTHSTCDCPPAGPTMRPRR